MLADLHCLFPSSKPAPLWLPRAGVFFYKYSSSQFIYKHQLAPDCFSHKAVVLLCCNSTSFTCSFISMSVILQAAIPTSGPPSYSRRQTSHRVSLPPGSPITQRSSSPSSPPGENTVGNLIEQRRRSSGAIRKRRALTLDMTATGKRVFCVTCMSVRTAV